MFKILLNLDREHQGFTSWGWVFSHSFLVLIVVVNPIRNFYSWYEFKHLEKKSNEK